MRTSLYHFCQEISDWAEDNIKLYRCQWSFPMGICSIALIFVVSETLITAVPGCLWQLWKSHRLSGDFSISSLMGFVNKKKIKAKDSNQRWSWSCKESNRGATHEVNDWSWIVPHGNRGPLEVLLLPVLPLSAGTKGCEVELEVSRWGGENRTSSRGSTWAARTTT